MDNNTYLKLSHLILNMLLRFDNWNTTILNAITNLFLLSSPIKALIGTFEIRLLQSRSRITKTINSHQVKEITNDENEDPEEKEIMNKCIDGEKQ